MSRTARRLLLALKTAFAVALVVAVGWHFARLLDAPQLAANPPAVRLEYLVPAGLLYLAAHTVWATFFVRLLRYEGAAVPWLVGVRAYFVSQFGKYIPGKVAVLALRILTLRGQGASHAVVGFTAAYETLTSMAAGAVIGVCTLPFTAFGDVVERIMGPWVWAGLIAVAGLPLGLAVMNRVVAKRLQARRGPDAVPLPCPSVRLLLGGVLWDAVGWVFLGLSLWLTVQGVSPQPLPVSVESLLGSLSIAALSYVAGFVLLISPGGLGAREGVVQAMLAAQLAPVLGVGLAGPVGVVVALVLRLVWTVFEVACALSLWWLARPAPAPAHAHPTPVPVTSPEAAHG